MPQCCTRSNPRFFKGTVVDQAVAEQLPGKTIAGCDYIDDLVVAIVAINLRLQVKTLHR